MSTKWLVLVDSICVGLACGGVNSEGSRRGCARVQAILVVAWSNEKIDGIGAVVRALIGSWNKEEIPKFPENAEFPRVWIRTIRLDHERSG